jgi:energy-coupling factor transport system permease protein
MSAVRARPLAGGEAGATRARGKTASFGRVGQQFAASRLPRSLHPVAWWVWAVALAVAASRTSNPLLLLLIFAVLGLTVALRRPAAPWARGYRFYLFMALAVIVIRVAFRVVFDSGASPGSLILFRLPHLPMPAWYSGIQIGGPVSAQVVWSAALDGARLACLLCCLGAANTLANPKRALRVLPGALYELGVAVTVALSVAPQLVESVQRVRRARRLRGAGERGVRTLRAVAVPVLHDALERSLLLAAGMDSRGYGRTGHATLRGRRLTSVLMLTGMAGLCFGAYGLLDATLPATFGNAGFAAGSGLCLAGLALGGRRVSRSRYRPDRWRWPECVVALCGVICAAGLCLHLGYNPAVLNPAMLGWPPLPPVPAALILVAAIAGFAAPPIVVAESQ